MTSGLYWWFILLSEENVRSDWQSSGLECLTLPIVYLRSLVALSRVRRWWRVAKNQDWASRRGGCIHPDFFKKKKQALELRLLAAAGEQAGVP